MVVWNHVLPEMKVNWPVSSVTKMMSSKLWVKNVPKLILLYPMCLKLKPDFLCEIRENLPTEQNVKKPLSHDFPDAFSRASFFKSISVSSWKTESVPFKSAWLVDRTGHFNFNLTGYMPVLVWICFSSPIFLPL